MVYDLMLITEKDYFALFGIEKSFDVDLSVVDEKYLTLQKQYHPDSGLFSDDGSAYINRAYTTIKSDISRAEYLLKEIFGFKPTTVSDIEFFSEVEKLKKMLIDRDDNLPSYLKLKQQEELIIIKKCFKENDLVGVAKSIAHYKFFNSIKKNFSNY